MDYYGLIKKHNKWFGLVPGARRTRSDHTHLIKLNHRPLDLLTAQVIWLDAFTYNMIQDAVEHDDGSMYIYFREAVKYGVEPLDNDALAAAEDDYNNTIDGFLAGTR